MLLRWLSKFQLILYKRFRVTSNSLGTHFGCFGHI